MIPFKIGDKNFNLPTNYGELTLSQFFNLRKCPENDYIQFISILTGISKKEWEQVLDFDIEYKLTPFLKWLEEPFIIEPNVVPDRIEIAGVRYKTPGGIGINTYGQKIALQNEIMRCEKAGLSEIDCYPFAIALYMQPIVTSDKYNSDKVDELVSSVMTCKLSEAWPLASFFLKNYKKYLLEREKNWLIALNRKKYRQALSDLKSSGNLQQYSLLRRLLIKVLMMLSSLITIRYMSHYVLKQSKTDTKKNSIK